MSIITEHATTICPYCAQPVSRYSGRMDCPHCERRIFCVPCPKCARPTLNLTLIARYGKAVCFACRSEFDRLPDADAETAPRQEDVVPVDPVTSRAPKHAGMPTAADARAMVENCLLGLERAAQDREMLNAPDLRAVINRFLDTLQATLELDTAMEGGEITGEWVAEAANLDTVARLCFAPLWPDEAVLLPPAVQTWLLLVDDAARRWQFARRRWLADTCGLEMMPIVPAITTTNPVWHHIIGEAPVISDVLAPGFLLRGDVVRKARVLAEPEP